MTRPNHPLARSAAATAVLALGVVACGGADASDPSTPATVAVTAVPAASAVTDAPTVPTVADAASATASSAAAVELADPCQLLPTADVAALTELAVDQGVPAGDERRRVCTFQDATSGVGITVGLEAGGRFEDKAEASRRALDIDGEELDGIGDRALFFFTDEDVPEGLGGLLVGVDDLTMDITVQGLDEEELRTATTGLAELALGNLAAGTAGTAGTEGG